MASLRSANVTKYYAGGSGDNYIAQGQIKSSDLYWIDSYTITTTALTTSDTISLGILPAGKQLLDLCIYVPAVGNGYAGGTNVTFKIGAGSLVGGTFATATSFYNKVVVDTRTAVSISLDSTEGTTACVTNVGFGYTPTSDTEILLNFQTTGGVNLTATSVTIKSKLSYM